VLDQRGRLLVAALGFAGLPMLSYDRALWALRSWLDSWPGIGAIATGMAREAYDLQLTRYEPAPVAVTRFPNLIRLRSLVRLVGRFDRDLSVGMTW